MHINSINNFNQSFTSFRVTRYGAKELAEEFAKDPDVEKAFVEKVIKPLAYTESSVIYDGNDNVLISPARDIVTYYKVLDKDLDVDSRSTGHEIKVPLMCTRTGEIVPIFVSRKDTDPDRIDMSSLENKFEIAKRVADVLDVANKYYEACNSSPGSAASQFFTENKLKRLYLIS